MYLEDPDVLSLGSTLGSPLCRHGSGLGGHGASSHSGHHGRQRGHVPAGSWALLWGRCGRSGHQLAPSGDCSGGGVHSCGFCSGGWGLHKLGGLVHVLLGLHDDRKLSHSADFNFKSEGSRTLLWGRCGGMSLQPVMAAAAGFTPAAFTAAVQLFTLLAVCLCAPWPA